MLLSTFAVMAVVSCEEPIDEPDEPSGGGGNEEQEAPTFPDLVEDYEVDPGSTLTLTFTPNYNWELSVPSETFKYFWILDNSFKVAKLTGNASEEAVTVTIGVSEEEEFDNNRSCEVTLTMNEESKVIAKYMRPAKNRTIALYTALTDADGGFQAGEDGSYVYDGTESASASLVWSAADADFRLPVKVDANCEWTVEVPEWLDVEVPAKTSGVVELVFTGVSLQENTGKVAFKAGDSVLKEMEVRIPSCKGIDVWEATVSEGELEYDENGYVWTEKPVETVSLVWLGSDFRIPVKVSSRCDWTLELPEWLSADVPAETAGELEFTLLGVPSKYPLKDTEGKIVFKFGEEVLHSMPVVIPGCKDIMNFGIDMSLTELAYNAEGWISTMSGYIEGPATGHLFGTKDAKVVAVETTEGAFGQVPAWFKVTLSSFNTADDADVLQERTVTFVAEKNEGYIERSAVIFFLPPGVETTGKDLFDKEQKVKEDYLQYSVPVHQLSSVYDDYLEVSSSDGDFTFEKADQQKAAALTDDFGETDHVYVLTYNAEYTRVWMNMAVSYDSIRIFGSDDSSQDKSSDPGFWLQYEGNESANNGVFDMYKDMSLPIEASTGHVVFYDKEGKVLAIVECVSPYVDPVLTIYNMSLFFASEASEKTFSITSNMDWTVTSDSDWCRVSPAEGSKDGIVTVSVDENMTSMVRNAVITVASKAVTATVTVEQRFGEVLEVSTTDIHFGFAAASEIVQLSSNVGWTVESSADWCAVTPDSGSGDCQLSVAVERNSTTEQRTAVLTITSGSLTAVINVSQDMDDGTFTNGDDVVHFVDLAAARAAGATLERLTSGDLYKEYRDGDTPVYHLAYTKESQPLRITLPETVAKHNVNPYADSRNIRVNDVLYDEYFGPNDILGEVVLDQDSSVAIHMYMPEGKDYLIGNVNFTTKTSDQPVVILICTLEL